MTRFACWLSDARTHAGVAGVVNCPVRSGAASRAQRTLATILSPVDMLGFLTQKLKSQSLREVQPFQSELKEDRDSGTESDDENTELEAYSNRVDEKKQLETSSYGSGSPSNLTCSPLTIQSLEMDTKTDACIELQLDNVSCTSDLERHSWDFDHHSSEEELENINRETHPEKRKWSQANGNCLCDSAGSSDEEVKELMLDPKPVLFSSAPPQGVQRVMHASAAKLLLPNGTPLSVCTISPRKRHRLTSSFDSCELEPLSVIPRPCLDFEKMQKTLVKKHNSHNVGRAKLVKIKTINRNGASSKCLFDPSVCSFRSISTGYNPLTSVEEPPCAY